MRRYLILLLAWTLMACVDKDETLSGRFTGTQRFGIGQVDSPIIIEISQAGNNLTGSVTPPFSNDLVPFVNGHIQGSMIRFDRKEDEITYRYEATLNAAQSTLQGGFQPLGCMEPESGEDCRTDSDGSFTAEKR